MPLRLLLAMLASLLMTGCTPLPSLEQRLPSHALSVNDAQMTMLGRTVSQLSKAHPGKSGVHPLSDPYEAFAVRVLLAKTAQRTLDVQYYIWRNDLTGTLLLHSLYEAAERGVRVRLLLDDSANAGMDALLSALDAHPNIEIRLFNPLAIRKPRWINYIVDFARVNRRMHNKSFTADNQVTIIGGRNIGDEYFGAAPDILFSDLDVIAAGPAANDVSNDFDRYWNSESAYPANLLLAPVSPGVLPDLADRTAVVMDQPEAAHYLQAIKNNQLIAQLISGDITLDWSPVRMLSDDPRKVLEPVPDHQLVVYDLQRYFGSPDSHLELVSAYFVPTRTGVEYLVGLAHTGVSINILTNSLAATDVAAVHAGYAKRRASLLEAGIKLYEMRPQNTHNVHRIHLNASGSGVFGSSGSSLHAKTLSIDGKRIFVGSFNFDPRSARLNTELGFVIDSPDLAQRIYQAFLDPIPAMTYEVKLGPDKKLYWIEHYNGQTRRYDNEPYASIWRRATVGFLSLLPIEWML